MTQLGILYFAWVRDKIGKDADLIDHPGGSMTISGLIDQLKATDSGYAEAFSDPDRLRAALDHAFVPLETKIGDACEVALFPPVTGG